MFQLPELKFEHNALEPFIDAQTMEIHHGKHHQGYVNKLNAALESHPDLLKKDIVELLKGWADLPDAVKEAVRNNGGGHFNHSLFWDILTPGSSEDDISDELRAAINNSFNNLDSFKEEFSAAAGSRFGSGWAWLVLDGEELKVTSTPNQDCPLMDGQIPILGIDVWEHAYYLNYQNKRPDYIQNFWKLVNWKQVSENFAKAK